MCTQSHILQISQTWTGFLTGIVAAGGIGLLLLLLFTPPPKSLGDLQALPMDWKRLQSARIVVFLLPLLAVLSQGMQGLAELSPVLAVLSIAGCYRLIVWLKN